jgi:hypothetical protein
MEYKIENYLLRFRESSGIEGYNEYIISLFDNNTFLNNIRVRLEGVDELDSPRFKIISDKEKIPKSILEKEVEISNWLKEKIKFNL